MSIKYTFIYGSAEHSQELLEAARLAALKAFSLVATNAGILVLDRYGIEQEVMKTCEAWSIPLLVIGTSARPRSGITMKRYERAILTMQDYQNREAQLRRYAMMKASGVVIIGDTPDCRAMRVYTVAVKKANHHTPAPIYTVPTAPDTDWIKSFGHFNISKV